MSRETGLNRERKERERKRERFLSPVHVTLLCLLLSSVSLRFRSLSLPLKFPKHFPFFSLYFPLFLLFVLLSRFLTSPFRSIPVCMLSSTASWIGLLSRLHPFQYLQTITHICSRGTVINHLLDIAETMVFVRLLVRYLFLLVQ